MNKIITSCILLALFFSVTLNAQQLSPQPIAPEQWLRSWLLCGPIPLNKPAGDTEQYSHLSGFNTDYLLKYGGEQNLSVKAQGKLIL